MPAPDNTAVASKLELMADLLEISGADKFRFLSYRKAARAVRAWPEQVAALANEERLTEIPGVGAKMAASIEQLVRRGSFDGLDELAERVPATLAGVMAVQGVGPKKASALYDELGVASIDDLERALEEHRLDRLAGFGSKTVDNISEGVAAYRRHHERLPLADALPLAEQLARDLEALPCVARAEPAGSVRRREETVGDIDILVSSTRPADVMGAVRESGSAERVIASGDTKTSVELRDGVQVDVRVVEPDAWGAALQYFTGSKEHNVRLRERAKSLGLKVNEYGVFRVADDERLGGVTEAEVYSLLDMDEPPPEIRAGTGEIDAAVAGKLPELLTLAEVRGDLQTHSTWTDGKTTIEQNRAMASKLGYEYFAATDHALELRMVGGLSIEDIGRQWAEIDALNAEPGPRVLKGIELNIGHDGSLDYDDDVLSGFDIVLASLHSGWDESEAVVTRRLLAAMDDPWVDVIAHPTGRIIGRRDAMRLDMSAVLEKAGATGTIVEINSYPDRLDLSAEHIMLARRFGVRFSLGTDAHAAEQMRYMRFGVSQARRGWVTTEELVNAQPWDVARTWLKRARLLG